MFILIPPISDTSHIPLSEFEHNRRLVRFEDPPGDPDAPPPPSRTPNPDELPELPGPDGLPPLTELPPLPPLPQLPPLPRLPNAGGGTPLIERLGLQWNPQNPTDGTTQLTGANNCYRAVNDRGEAINNFTFLLLPTGGIIRDEGGGNRFIINPDRTERRIRGTDAQIREAWEICNAISNGTRLTNEQKTAAASNPLLDAAIKAIARRNAAFTDAEKTTCRTRRDTIGNDLYLLNSANLMRALGGLEPVIEDGRLVYKPQSGNERYILIPGDRGEGNGHGSGFYREPGVNSGQGFRWRNGSLQSYTPRETEDLIPARELSRLGLAPTTGDWRDNFTPVAEGRAVNSGSYEIINTSSLNLFITQNGLPCNVSDPANPPEGYKKITYCIQSRGGNYRPEGSSTNVRTPAMCVFVIDGRIKRYHRHNNEWYEVSLGTSGGRQTWIGTRLDENGNTRSGSPQQNQIIFNQNSGSWERPRA